MIYGLPRDRNSSIIPVFSPAHVLNWTLDVANSRTYVWQPDVDIRVIMIQATQQISVSLNGEAGFFPIPAGAIMQFGVNNINTMTISSTVDASVYVMVQ